MIRTLIEVTADYDHEHERNLKKALGDLGYVPKESTEYVEWRADLYAALDKRGLNPADLVEEIRKERFQRELDSLARSPNTSEGDER